MTSDAKIGLLLGLVFIFVIAFVINGLPGLHKNDDSNKLTNNMVGLESSQQMLGENARKLALENSAAPGMQPGPEQQSQPVYQNSEQTQANPAQTDPRFQMALPQGAAAPAPTPGAMTVQPAQIQDVVAAPSQPASAPLVENPVSAQAVKTQTAKLNAPQTYVVQDGDSLSSIAKKVYGDQLGSKLVNVKAIYEANKKTLASPDDLQVGQKLAVPVLTASAPAAPAVLTSQNFAKVDSVGQRHSTVAAQKPAAAPKTDTSKQGKVYVVKEGDSLWRIASSNLGDGNRYKEIVKLNNLSSEDDIQVGMQLKLPAK